MAETDHQTDQTFVEVPPADTDSLTKLLSDYDINALAEMQPEPLEESSPPWRVAIDLVTLSVQIIFDLHRSIIIGRSHSTDEPFVGIDLSPYNAHKKGVSRQHIQLTLLQGNVVIRDLNSRNGTVLNGRRVKPETNYILHTGDLINLGKFQLRIRFLDKPF